MKRIGILAAAGLPVAVAAVLAAPALGAGAKVSFRVDGASQTLLSATTVAVPTSGWITKGGTPKGSCPEAGTAAGAFNAATHGDWTGKDFSFGIEVNSILGESVNNRSRFWELFDNDHVANAGICDLKVKRGDQLLFASVPTRGKQYPIVLKAPSKATVGRPFQVKAFYYRGASAAMIPLPGVSFAGVKGTTNLQGVVSVTPSRAGKLSLVGSEPAEIRSAAASVVVSK
ncbi:MAG: hypothetical protein WAL22_01700 [Solirubrobacteraceae bacterium]